jgi:DNA ligase-1
MGALRVTDAEGRTFHLGNGFTNAQRDNPPAIGSLVTYRYRGLTQKGLPRFASFLRVRELP